MQLRQGDKVQCRLTDRTGTVRNIVDYGTFRTMYVMWDDGFITDAHPRTLRHGADSANHIPPQPE